MSWFYTNLSYIGNKIYVKGYKDDGSPIKGTIPFKPFLFVESNRGEYKGFEGQTLERLTFDNFEEIKEFNSNNTCYGLGVGGKYVSKKDLTYTFIVDNFKNDIEYNQKYIKIFNFDIETTSERGFPDYRNPVEEVISISTSLLFKGKRHYKTFGIKECLDDTVINYERCFSEEELLHKFCKYVRDCDADVFTHWNGTRFDIPYLCSRIERKYNKAWLKLLSPFNIQPKMIHKNVKNRKTNRMEEYDIYDIAGVSDMDMMRLYAKFNQYNGSMALNNIANIEVGEKKLDYSVEGSLHNLYKTDYDKFIRYNQQDVFLVDKLVDKLKLIDLGINIAYLSKTMYEDCFGTIVPWDVLIYSYLIDNHKTIVPRRKNNEKLEQNRGGRVKDARKGFGEYVVTTDAESLYPSIIVSLNLSPETFVKKIDVNEESVLNMTQNNKWLEEANYCLASNGCLFDRSKEGVLSHLVGSIFEQRKDYKNKMKALKKENNPENENLIAKYDVFQYALKIFINSAYGCFSSANFRFYDIDIAEAITVTGQTIIQLSDKTINDYLHGYLGNKERTDYVIFSDTDSCGIELKEVVEREMPENFVDFLDDFYSNKIDPEIKKAFNKFSDYNNFYLNKINFKREKIIGKMIITAKKRYGMLCYDNEGYRYEEPEIIIKGLEIIQSSTPIAIKDKLFKAIEIILKGDEEQLQKFVLEFKKEFVNLPLEDIANLSGVYGLEKYKAGEFDEGLYAKGATANVKASLVYNNFIKQNNLEKEYELIKDSDKIKIISLKEPNVLQNDRFAVKHSFDEKFGIHEIIDYNKQFLSFLRPLDRLLDVVGWTNEKQINFADLI